MTKFNSQILKFPCSHILFGVLVWGLLVLRYGYTFGTGDQIELLPYTLYLHDHSLYAHDFFIQGLIQKSPNERSILSYSLLPFVNHLEIVCFFLHFFFTVMLMVGLQKLGALLIGNIHLARAAILVNFLLLFNKGLGDIELYSGAVQASSISVSFIAFGLYYFFKRNYYLATILMSVASVIHPVEGLTVYLVMLSSMFFFTVFLKEVRIKTLLICGFIYAFTAGVFIGFLLWGKIDGVSAYAPQFNHENFYRIYFEFRHPHHFLFRYMSWTVKLLFVVFMLVNLAWSYVNNKRLFWFNILSLTGLIIYIFCTDRVHLIDIATLQFYKVTQWIKFFAVLIVLKAGADLTGVAIENRISRRLRWQIGGLSLIVVAMLLVVKPAWLDRPGIYHQYGKNWEQQDALADISIRIDSMVDRNAVFVQPFGCTELKYFGRVSSWVDWKAFMKNRGSIFEWYRRIQMVYGISIDDPEKGFDLDGKADNYFFNLNADKAQKLKAEGVTHILTANKQWPYGKLLFQNSRYAVYKL